METLAQVLLLLLFVGFVKAWINGGPMSAMHFIRLKVIGA